MVVLVYMLFCFIDGRVLPQQARLRFALKAASRREGQLRTNS
jgi:hypothetical protein